MPTQAAAVAVNAINSATIRVPAVASAEQKDGFQALLEIGAEADAGKNQRSAQDDRDRRGEEIVAAPVNGDISAANQPSPVHEDGDHDAHVRAYENDNDRNRRDTSDISEDRPVAERAEVRNVAQDRRPEKTAAPARTVEATDDLRDDLLDDLRDRLATLNEILDLFASFGGNPQTVQVKVDSVLLKVSTVTVTAAAIDVDASATLQDGAARLDGLLKDILAQLAQLQDALADGTPDATVRTGKSFQDLMQDIRQLALQLNGKPQVAEAVVSDRTQLIEATRALIDQHTRLLKKISDVDAENSDVAATGKDNNVVKIATRQALPELAAQLPGAARTDAALTPAATTAAPAATAYIAPNSGAETRTGSDGQNGNNQSLPQNIGAVRNVGQPQAAQAANGPSFNQLLQQAREPVLDQVRVQIRTAENRSDIKIQLQPEDLGRLEIKMQVGADGKTGVTVTADNKNTLDLLQRDMRGLQQALADAGLKADSGSLSFNLRQGQQDNQSGQGGFAQSYRNPLAEEAEMVAAPALARSYVVNMRDGLDLTV